MVHGFPLWACMSELGSIHGCEVGASGCGVGPLNVIQPGEVCCPTPGFVQSHTPDGNTACSRARCAVLRPEYTGSAKSMGRSWHLKTSSVSGPPATWRGEFWWVTGHAGVSSPKLSSG